MARLRDVPVVFRHIGAWTFVKRVWQQIGEDNVFTWGAALAYSWLFAVFPFLVFLLSLVPLIPEQYKPNLRQEIEQVVDRTLAGQAAEAVKTQVLSILDRDSAAGGFLSFGLLLTIWAASGGMAMTMAALDKAYDIEKSRPYVKTRLIAIGLTIVVASLIILVLILLPIGNRVIDWLSSQGSIFGWVKVLLDVLRYALALLLLFTVLALIYHFGPSFKQKFHTITPGALFVVTVWLLLSFGFNLYMTQFGGSASYTKTYGAVAGAVILLLFFYIDALVLLVGAEINSEIDFAVLGIPRGGMPPEQVAAVASESETAKEPEQQAMADELRDRTGIAEREAAAAALRQPERRAGQTPGHPGYPGHPAQPVQRAGGGFSIGSTLGRMAGFWVASHLVSSLVQSRRKARDARNVPVSRPDRLRSTYPLTYALIHESERRGSAHPIVAARAEDGHLYANRL